MIVCLFYFFFLLSIFIGHLILKKTLNIAETSAMVSINYKIIDTMAHVWAKKKKGVFQTYNVSIKFKILLDKVCALVKQFFSNLPVAYKTIHTAHQYVNFEDFHRERLELYRDMWILTFLLGEVCASTKPIDLRFIKGVWITIAHLDIKF